MARLKWSQESWGTFYAVIPGAEHGEAYTISQRAGGRWDVGTSGKLGWCPPGVGTYGADRLMGGQPTHASPEAAKRWVGRLAHARWARAMARRRAQCFKNVEAGLLG